MHHPFTMPYEEDMQYLFSDPARVRAQAYDAVLNGTELGSGSIRIHRQDVQQQMFKALGFSQEDINSRFGFMVGAFKYGTPPHGGFAFGLDRLVMLLCGADSLREIIAFPKNKEAVCMMTNAPDKVDIAQLRELSLVGAFTGADEDAKPEGKGGKSGGIDVDSVAALARLIIPEGKKEKMARDMMEIVAFADKLASAPTAGVKPVEQRGRPWKTCSGRHCTGELLTERSSCLMHQLKRKSIYMCRRRLNKGKGKMRELTKYSITELSRLISRREVSAAEVTEEYLENIREKDGHIGAYITVTEDAARKKAAQVDKKIAAGEKLPPLAGIPGGIKDNM